MHLGPLDWSIIAATFAAYLAVGLWAGRTAGGGFEAFFLGNRGQPWWLLGTSMVATTFATYTPNLVAGIVREYGVIKRKRSGHLTPSLARVASVHF